MGVPDYLALHPETAARFGVPAAEYETKGFGGNFGRLTVDAYGRLIEHMHAYETLQTEAVPLMRRAEKGDRWLKYHGDVRLTAETDSGFVDLVTRFSDGVVTFIWPWANHPVELRDIVSRRS